MIEITLLITMIVLSFTLVYIIDKNKYQKKQLIYIIEKNEYQRKQLIKNTNFYSEMIILKIKQTKCTYDLKKKNELLEEVIKLQVMLKDKICKYAKNYDRKEIDVWV